MIDKPIKKLEEMVPHLLKSGKKYKIAVASAQDPNTIDAVAKGVSEGFIEAIMVGSEKEILRLCNEKGIKPETFNIIDIPDEVAATAEALRLVKEDEADILMKGLVGTDKFLKAVLNKEKGLLPKGNIMSYVCALELPAYKKLLFVSDTAVLPYPDLKQKQAMVDYSVKMAQNLGIQSPKIALISSSEKVSPGTPPSCDDAILCKMAERGWLKDCIIDGPLDLFLACDPASVEIKGVKTQVNGDADILIFPSLEACNSFYKGLMLFAGGELAGMIQGTEKPVVVMSRSETPASKYYCIALSCLMAE